MDWFKLNRLLLNYKKSQYFFFGPHYPIQYEPEFLLQDLYEVCPHYLLLSEKYTDLEDPLADDSLQRVYVKGEPLLKDLYEVAPYYTTRERIVTNQGIFIELNRLLLNYKKSQYFFFGPHYPIQYEPEFLLHDLYEVCPHYLLLSEKYTDLEDPLADDSLQRVYVKGEPLLKDLYEVAPYYTTREHIVTNQGILIEQDEVKYLGIIFDNTLKFITHINNITQKIGKVVGVLWKGRSLPLSIKLKIYYSLIYSQLNFAILVWESIISKNINGSTEFEHVPKQLKNVNTVHNKAVRALVCARKRDPLSKIFRELRLLKLIDIYYYKLGIFAYQTFTSGCPHFFDNYAISHNKHARYVTRSTKNTVFDFTSDPIFHNQPHLQKTLQSIKFSAAALWNKLPLTLKQLINVTTFKSQLKAWLTKDYTSSRETIILIDMDQGLLSHLHKTL